MIPTDVYIELLSNKLANEKSLYDYIQLILPFISSIVGALLGWFIASKNNKQIFRQQLLVEKNNQKKDTLLKIVTLHSEFINYFNDFIRVIRNKHLEDDEIDINDFEVFSSNCQLKYVFIQELISIEYFNIKTNQAIIYKQIEIVETIVREISRLRSLVMDDNIKITLEKEIVKLNIPLQAIVDYTASIDDVLIKDYIKETKETVRKEV